MNELHINSKRQEDVLPKINAIEFSPEKLKELRLFGFFSFTLWPILLIIALFAAVITLIKAVFIKSRKAILKKCKVCLAFIFLPWHLIKLGFSEGNSKIVFGLVLLIPFILAFTINIYTIFFPVTIQDQALKPPSFTHPFGTSGEGFGIGKLIITGARHTYFTSMIAVSFVLGLGVWLGKITFHHRAESIIMGLVQVIETIPILFLLLIVLTVFSWWEDIWKSSGFGSVLMTPLRMLIVGIIIGFGFLPRMIRLVRERIKTFVSENFVDGTKAHGIEQNRILWFHIIKKNCIGDIIISITQIWAAVILIEISLDYLISISPLLGAKIYESWAGMLLTFEVRNALVNFLPQFKFDYWWLYVFPGLFIISTVIGFYLYGDGLRAFYQKKFTFRKSHTSNFDRVLNGVALKVGIIE